MYYIPEADKIVSSVPFAAGVISDFQNQLQQTRSRLGKIDIRPNGARLSPFALTTANHGGGGKRGAIRGWSESTRRRHTDFLQGIDFLRLLGVGDCYGFTLTSKQHMNPIACRQFWLYALQKAKRNNVLIYHNKEFQKRGAVHFHGFTVGGGSDFIESLWRNWCAAHGFYVGDRGVDVRRVFDIRGWSQYLAKHCHSTFSKSQRCAPKSWAGKVRLWGHSEGLRRYIRVSRVIVSGEIFPKLRRLILRKNKADAREAFHTIPSQFRAAFEYCPIIERDCKAKLQKVANRAGRLYCKKGNKVGAFKPVNVWFPSAAIHQFLAVLLI